MKREYFGMLFIVSIVGIIFLFDYFIGDVWDILSRYIVIWILIGFYAGQYSMRFPKAF